MEEAAGSKRQREEDEEVQNDEVVKLAMQLINVESLSGHEQPMAVVVRQWLEQRDWVVQLQEVEPQKSTVGGQPRHNLYARRTGIPATRTEGPRVLFNSHIDTVSPAVLQFCTCTYCCTLGVAARTTCTSTLRRNAILQGTALLQGRAVPSSMKRAGVTPGGRKH